MLNKSYLSHFATLREVTGENLQLFYNPILDVNTFKKRPLDEMSHANLVLLSTETKTAIDAELADRDMDDSSQFDSHCDLINETDTTAFSSDKVKTLLLTETITEIQPEQPDHLESDLSLSLLATETFTKVLGEQADRDLS